MREWCADSSAPLVLVSGEGAILHDDAGREYIDGNSSIWTNIHGHNHPRINRAIESQLQAVAHVSFLGTTNVPAARLAAELAGLFPPDTLERVFFSDDGSTAVEAAIKMAVQYWQLTGEPSRTMFVAFDGAYHGDTAGAASLGGIGTFTRRFEGHHFPVLRVSNAEELQELDAWRSGRVAGVIIEPLVQGAAGIRLWPQGLLAQLAALCRHNGALLILDEVLTGFGRTGTLFACEQEQVVPDMLCLAKGLTGGYLPMAATLTTRRVFEAFLGEYHELKTFFYGHSYTGNALAAAAALENLAIFRDENVLEQLSGKIALLAKELQPFKDDPRVLEIRRCGFISGIELRDKDGSPLDWRKRTGARVCEAARNHGLLTRPILDTIVLMLPLCATHDQISKSVAAIRQAMDDVF